jgi:hypothetical protein
MGYHARGMPDDTRLAETLAPIEVLDPTLLGSENRVKLGSLWADRACVLVFVRHFG